MFRRFLMSAAVAAFASVSLVVNAASYSITPVLKTAYTPDFSSVIDPYDPATAGVPVVLQYDFWLDFTPTGNETLGAVVFDIELEGLTVNAALPGWQAFNPNVDTNGPSIPGGQAPLWANAADLGDIDLKNITHGVAANLTTNPTVDPRLRVGTGAGIIAGQDPMQDIDILGSLYVDWNGTSPAKMTINLTSAGFRNAADGLLIVDADAVRTGAEVVLAPGGGGGNAEFASTPGDLGILDFGYGAAQRTVNLAVRNVGDPGTTIEVASATLSDGSLFSLPGFAPLTLNAGAGDSNIVVQFNGIGTPGIYTDTLTLRDADQNVLGTYTLTAAVPEPSTIALAGLGLLGLVGFARRRG